jgi:hypothetical protein
MLTGSVKSRKPFRARNERLQDVLDRLRDTAMKPKSRLWLMRLMRDVYRDKAAADQLQDRAGQPHVSMPDFLFEYLKQLYGERNLVDRNACAVVATASSLRDSDPHVDTFARFLEEEWSLEILDMYLKATSLIEDLKVGLSYTVAANDLTRVRHVDTERAHLCTQLVLGERHPTAEAQLRTWLADHSEPATEADLRQLVGRQQLRNDALSAADADRAKIDKHLYLFHACELFALYDGAFSSYIQEMFRNTDDDVDGFVTKQEFVLLLSREMPSLMPMAIDETWLACLAASLDPAGGRVDYKGFGAVLTRSEAARVQFRTSFVPDPEATGKADELEGHQQLVVSLSRHWLAFTPVFQKALAIIKAYTLGSAHRDIFKLSSQLSRYLRTDIDPIRALAYYRQILAAIASSLIELQSSFKVLSGESEIDAIDLRKCDEELGALEKNVMHVFDYVKGRCATSAIPVARQLAKGATLGSIIGALTKHTRTDSYQRHVPGQRGNDDNNDDADNDAGGGGGGGDNDGKPTEPPKSIEQKVKDDLAAARRGARAFSDSTSTKRKLRKAKKKARANAHSGTGKLVVPDRGARGSTGSRSSHHHHLLSGTSGAETTTASSESESSATAGGDGFTTAEEGGTGREASPLAAARAAGDADDDNDNDDAENNQ